MTAPNRNFDLTIEDIELIEEALRRSEAEVLNTAPENAETLHRIHALLGRLHNQKTFYRPSSEVYIGG